MGLIIPEKDASLRPWIGYHLCSSERLAGRHRIPRSLEKLPPDRVEAAAWAPMSPTQRTDRCNRPQRYNLSPGETALVADQIV